MSYAIVREMREAKGGWNGYEVVDRRGAVLARHGWRDGVIETGKSARRTADALNAGGIGRERMLRLLQEESMKAETRKARSG